MKNKIFKPFPKLLSLSSKSSYTEDLPLLIIELILQLLWSLFLWIASCQIQITVILMILLLASSKVRKALISLLANSQISSPHNVQPIMDVKLSVFLTRVFAKLIEFHFKKKLMIFKTELPHSTLKCFQNYNKLLLKINKPLMNLDNHSLKQLQLLFNLISDASNNAWINALMITIIIQICSLIALP